MSFEQYAAARMDSFGRLAYVLTGDPHEARDLLQETFTRLYAAWPRIRDRGALDAFTTTTMTRVLLSWRRRPVWRRERLSADPVAAAKPVAVDFADRVVHRDALAEALNHLSPQQRQSSPCATTSTSANSKWPASWGARSGPSRAKPVVDWPGYGLS